MFPQMPTMETAERGFGNADSKQHLLLAAAHARTGGRLSRGPGSEKLMAPLPHFFLLLLLPQVKIKTRPSHEEVKRSSDVSRTWVFSVLR